MHRRRSGEERVELARRSVSNARTQVVRRNTRETFPIVLWICTEYNDTGEQSTYIGMN